MPGRSTRRRQRPCSRTTRPTPSRPEPEDEEAGRELAKAPVETDAAPESEADDRDEDAPELLKEESDGGDDPGGPVADPDNPVPDATAPEPDEPEETELTAEKPPDAPEPEDEEPSGEHPVAPEAPLADKGPADELETAGRSGDGDAGGRRGGGA